MNHLTYEDLNVGQSAAFTREDTAEMMQQFRAVSGDNNPLHVSSDFARDHGFSDRVVYGMLTASIAVLQGNIFQGSAACCKAYTVTFCIPYLLEIHSA